MNSVKQKVISELIIKNSKFITIVYPIITKEEVEPLLLECKKDYPKATHYCYCYITTQYKKVSDDGEPSGTAGLPILNVLEKEHMQNILVVVIRYFGGIKLGAGGLIRAYSKATKQALKKAELLPMVKAIKCEITIPYEQVKNMNQLLQTVEIVSEVYLENITYTILVPENHPLIKQKNTKILETTYMKKPE